MISRTRHQTSGRTVRRSWPVSCEAPSKVPARAGATVSAGDDDTSIAPAASQGRCPQKRRCLIRKRRMRGHQSCIDEEGLLPKTEARLPWPRARSERSPRFRPSFLCNITESAAGFEKWQERLARADLLRCTVRSPPACFSMINAHLSTLEHRARVEK